MFSVWKVGEPWDNLYSTSIPHSAGLVVLYTKLPSTTPFAHIEQAMPECPLPNTVLFLIENNSPSPYIAIAL